MSLHTLAQHLQKSGRNNDTVLVHMNPKEVSGLQSLAMAHGGSLTINPQTGLPEAGFLSSILPMIAGAGLMMVPGMQPMAAAMLVGAAGTVATGSLGKGLMMGLGAYGGAGLGAGLSAAGAGAANTAGLPTASATAGDVAANTAITSGTSFGVNAGAGTNMAGNIPQTAFVPANINNTGTSVFENFQKAGRGLSNVFGDGPEGDQARTAFASQISKPQMYGMGISALQAARQEQMDALERQQREANKPSGPYKPTYTFDSGFNPAASAVELSGERQYFNPQFNPIRYADGGGVMGLPMQDELPVEQMSNFNAIGANTRYPMANQITPEYATLAQRPVSENVLTPMTNYNVDPFSGEQKFAKGGLAGLAHYADGGKTMTLVAAIKKAKEDGIERISSIGGAQGLADKYKTSITVGAKTYTPTVDSSAKPPPLPKSSTTTSYPWAYGYGGGQPVTKKTDLSNTKTSTASASDDWKHNIVPDLSAKDLKKYTNLSELKDLVLRTTGLANLTLAQNNELNNLIKTKTVTNENIETLIDKLMPKEDESEDIVYTQLSSMPTSIGGDNLQPIFINASSKELQGKASDVKDSNIYIKEIKSITKISDLDSLTMALYGRKATLKEFEKYKTAKIGKMSLEDIYYDMQHSDAYYDFVDDQTLAYEDKFSATPAQIQEIYQSLFNKPAPSDIVSNYDDLRLTPTNLRTAIINSPEYQSFKSPGLVPNIIKDAYPITDITSNEALVNSNGALVDSSGALVDPTPITDITLSGTKDDPTPITDITLSGTKDDPTPITDITLSGKPGDPTKDDPTKISLTAAEYLKFVPQTADKNIYKIKPLSRVNPGITPIVSEAFTPDYTKSSIQNALAEDFKPSSVFALPSISVPNVTVGYMNGNNNSTLKSNMFTPGQQSVSPFNQYANLTQEQINKLTPTEFQAYLASMQTPVGNNIYSAGTYQPFSFAKGGMASGPSYLGNYSDGDRLLKGPGDGVSDSIPAFINDKQPARLANNEFVIPARIVSEIGNGSTDAGAKKLYEMMDRVQRKRASTVGKGKIAVNSRAYKELDRL